MATYNDWLDTDLIRYDRLADRLTTNEDPRLHLQGAPPVFSTGMALERRPAFAWDVNRYYRDLGIGWPYTNASRGDLRRAYLGLNGPSDARLTYVFKQLLDREVKARYDATGLGVLFLDVYVLAEMKRRVVERMARQGLSLEDTDGVKATYAEYGITMEDESDTDSGILDKVDEVGHDESRSARTTSAYPYSFYLWRTRNYDLHVLKRWQGYLLEAARERRLCLRFALGMMGRTPHRWVVGEMGADQVVFLNVFERPDIGTARQIIEALSPAPLTLSPQAPAGAATHTATLG